MNVAIKSMNNKKMVTVHRSIVGDLETPISAFLKLCADGPSFLLESATGGEQVARYSFLGYNPFLTLKGCEDGVELQWKDGKVETRGGDPLEVLRKVMDDYRLEAHPTMPRFSGGAVGYFSYDTVARFEPVGELPPDELGLPEIYMQFMKNIVVFDHFTHQLQLMVNRPVKDGESVTMAERLANGELQQMVLLMSRPLPDDPRTIRTFGTAPVGNMTEAEFVERVKTAKDYIKYGDIFQVVLSQRFTTEVTEDPFVIYRRLRSVNPSPYMFFLNNEEMTIVGASPEMLVRLEGTTLTTRPIAGTRKRGMTEEEDAAMEKELLADEKEMAEHVMLVDLGRNDIGRVARYGTVQVKEYGKVERFSHVMHLVSEVSGELEKGQDALSALRACFPAGTLTGAPKVRAMQIINELEPTRRGPYGGAIGYLDFTGNMDTCITIRTMVIKDGKAYIQTGAGIVADSVPELEYAETLHKAKAMFATLGVDRK